MPESTEFKPYRLAAGSRAQLESAQVSHGEDRSRLRRKAQDLVVDATVIHNLWKESGCTTNSVEHSFADVKNTLVAARVPN
jgi:hypothetical protein